MDWLSGWLKSIILVILLATFVDLLLPNQTMQRYVKTVMGLFILLTLLHPLFSLFQQKTKVDELLAGALLQQSKSNTGQLTMTAGGVPAAEQVQVKSLPTIKQQADALRAKQEQQAHHLVQQQAAEVMKRSIEQNLGVKVGQVQVETATDPAGNKVIRHVTIALNAEVKPPAKEGKAAASEPIRPMQPVQIQIDKGQPAPDKPKSTGDALEVSAPELEQKRTQVVHLLRQDWQLQEQQVTVSWLESKPKL